MSYTLCASLLCRNPHRENSEKTPDKPSLATSFLNRSPIARAHSDIDCLSTPCPKCSKRSIVQRSPNTFDCLNCNFHKRLPPISTRHQLAVPGRSPIGKGKIGRGEARRLEARRVEARRLEARRLKTTGGLDSYGLGNTETEGNGLDSGLIGQGGLSRFLETNRSPLYITPNHITPNHTPTETDTAQPIICAVIAVIVGILIL